jgi:hypothetical protein
MAQVIPPDIDAFIQAMIAAANAAAAAAVPPVPPVPPIVPPAPFSLLPGGAYTTPLDYSKSSELKIFRASTTGMSDKFDLKEEHLRVFLETVKEHVRTYNWETIITVPDGNAVNRNLITNYGQLTLDNVTAHAINYVNQQNRDAQNSMLLYKYLLDSLTEEAKLIMVTMANQYHHNDLPVGALFLKSIIGRSSIDTKAKVLLLRESVSHLYMKMGELRGNVREFNQHVSDLKSALAGRGQDVSELIMHLFKAYEQVPDAQFARYIESIRDRYDADLEDITADQLMHLAVNKYDLLLQRNAMPSDNADRIVALPATAVREARNNSSGRRAARPEDAWKKVAPKTGESTTKSVKNKTYHYCDKHKAWCIHTSEQCLLNIPDSGGSNTTDKQKTANVDKLIIDKAYHAIIHEYDDEDD